MKNIDENIDEMYNDDRFVGFEECDALMVIGEAKDVLSMVKRSVYFLERMYGVDFNLYGITPSMLVEKFNEYVEVSTFGLGEENYNKIILSKGFIDVLKEKKYEFMFKNFFKYGDLLHEELLKLSILYPVFKLQEMYGINE